MQAALAGYAAALDPGRSALGDILRALNGTAPAGDEREARAEAVREAWASASKDGVSG